MSLLPPVSQNAYSSTESYFMSIWHNRLYLYSAAALVFGIWFSLKVALKKVNSLLAHIIKSLALSCPVCVVVVGMLCYQWLLFPNI